ncbi:hypothetical protein ACG7TL_005833 [Trametes sanguinea]
MPPSGVKSWKLRLYVPDASILPSCDKSTDITFPPSVGKVRSSCQSSALHSFTKPSYPALAKYSPERYRHSSSALSPSLSAGLLSGFNSAESSVPFMTTSVGAEEGGV